MDKVNGVVWGDFGAGKTPFCGTLEAYEKTSPCLFLDVDHGTLSLNSVNPKPTVFTIKCWSDIGKAYGLIERKDWVGLAKLVGTDQPKEYKSAVIDSGTELAMVLLREIVDEDDKNNGVADQAAYLRTQTRFSTMWKAFRDLPITCIMTAGVKDQKDDVSGIIRLYPQFSPGLLYDLLRHADFILFMSANAEKDGDKIKYIRSLQTQPTNRFVCRDRSGLLAPIIRGEKLYWGDILKKVLV